MRRSLAIAVCGLLFVAAPSWATSLQIHEDSLGRAVPTGCNDTDANGADRSCAPGARAAVPETGAGALLVLGLSGLALGRRRRVRGPALLALSALWLSASPAGAASLQIFESTSGAPGVTASFPSGTGLVADLDLDASSAEGGGLLVGATEIELRPSGSVQLVSFSCAVPGCLFVLDPGGEGDGAVLRISDPDPQPHGGIVDLGELVFDAPSDGALHLMDCHYIGQDATERQCSAAQVVSLPEPAAGGALFAGAALLAALRRRR